MIKRKWPFVTLLDRLLSCYHELLHMRGRGFNLFVSLTPKSHRIIRTPVLTDKTVLLLSCESNPIFQGISRVQMLTLPALLVVESIRDTP